MRASLCGWTSATVVRGYIAPSVPGFVAKTPGFIPLLFLLVLSPSCGAAYPSNSCLLVVQSFSVC